MVNFPKPVFITFKESEPRQWRRLLALVIKPITLISMSVTVRAGRILGSPTARFSTLVWHITIFVSTQDLIIGNLGLRVTGNSRVLQYVTDDDFISIQPGLPQLSAKLGYDQYSRRFVASKDKFSSDSRLGQYHLWLGLVRGQFWAPHTSISEYLSAFSRSRSWNQGPRSGSTHDGHNWHFRSAYIWYIPWLDTHLIVSISISARGIWSK